MPRLTHIERGCCPGGPPETHLKMFGAICRSNILLGGHGDLPSKHRIGSTTAANAQQCGGFMLHSFLPRCFMESFRTWGDAAANDDDGDDDYRKAVRKKLWRVIHSIGPQEDVDRLVCNWLAYPLDHSWMKIQLLDAQGNVIRRLVRRETNPFVETVRQYTNMIVEPLDEGPLKTLIYHFQGQFSSCGLGVDDDVSMDGIVDNIRTLACSVSCQITWRIIWQLEGWPFRAVLIVEALLDGDQQFEIAREVFESSDCELDPFFLRKASIETPPYPPRPWKIKENVC